MGKIWNVTGPSSADSGSRKAAHGARPATTRGTRMPAGAARASAGGPACRWSSCCSGSSSAARSAPSRAGCRRCRRTTTRPSCPRAPSRPRCSTSSSEFTGAGALPGDRGLPAPRRADRRGQGERSPSYAGELREVRARRRPAVGQPTYSAGRDRGPGRRADRRLRRRPDRRGGDRHPRRGGRTRRPASPRCVGGPGRHPRRLHQGVRGDRRHPAAWSPCWWCC